MTFPEASAPSVNPFFSLNYEPALESLGGDYYDPVVAADFPVHQLRFRNDALLPLLGLDSSIVTDDHWIAAFGRFQGPQPCLALRYHGYQFGQYNPALGDGRGFLYGQVRGADGELYDFGTKGSGTTPYSRGGDGRLTLKGGVREVLAAEMLYRMGVRTSRCLSMIETGEALWRGDEPSPTRSSVMVRFSRSHIRFGTFERLAYFDRKDLVRTLLDHVIACYYPHLVGQPDADARFYAELVQRVAELVAQWMAAGFCHAVLNTDNMSITGESFDYGPYAFIPTYNPNFTAAYFDHFGRYSYRNQPAICRWNLEMLQRPLQLVMPQSGLDAGLNQFEEHYYRHYTQRMLARLGFSELTSMEAEELIRLTLQFLLTTQASYATFFWELTRQFSTQWRENPEAILMELDWLPDPSQAKELQPWRQFYYHLLQRCSDDELTTIGQRLRQQNPANVIVRPEIERVWNAIADEDNWQPFYDLLRQIQTDSTT